MQDFLLNEDDFRKVAPYLQGVVNLEVKEYPNRNKHVKEILLEKNDGQKFIGDLNAGKFELKQLTGITSIAEYFARGKYGSTNWRGNCSGLLIKDLLTHFKPKHPIDAMCGSGTFGEVCDDLGLTYDQFDLNPKYGGFNALKDDLPRSYDFIFVHPPYFVYPGSSMPQYSGKMWGKESHPDDGSWIQDEEQFTRWFNKIQANLYQGLRKGGRMCILMGDSRSKGQYYSMFKNMNIYGDLENVIIKRQYNCVSDTIKYSGKFIPIQHENLVIIRKNDEYVIKCLLVNKTEVNIMNVVNITWRSLIQNIVEKMGGKATRDQIYDAVKNHPKAKNNNNLKEKIRQVINTFPTEFVKVDSHVVALAA